MARNRTHPLLPLNSLRPLLLMLALLPAGALASIPRNTFTAPQLPLASLPSANPVDAEGFAPLTLHLDELHDRRVLVRQNPWSSFDPFGLYDGPGDNPLLEKSEKAAAEGRPWAGMGWGLLGALRGIPGAISHTKSEADKGMATARKNIDAKIDSGEYGLGTAGMARGLQFMGGFTAGTTALVGDPVETIPQIPAGVAGQFKMFGQGAGEFCEKPSLRSGLDVTESAANIALMAFGLRSAFAAKSIATPYGPAVQSMTAEAQAALRQVQGGATLYKGGFLGQSEAGVSQFLSLENPLSPGFAARYGIPPQNVNFDFILSGRLQPGASVITRPAPGVLTNPGGAIEAVTTPGSFIIDSFHMP